MAGPPYHANPQVVVKQWTLPQALHLYVGKQEADSANARQRLMILVSAIGCSFSKNGNFTLQKLLRDLDGPGMDVEDVMEQLNDSQLKVLFGDQALKERQDGNSPDTN